MSRCFPFPPPGYDKKINTTDSELLKKEKDRDKKHKKDKKDREKKEDRRKDDKEKRDKGRSDGKSKEKKDRKEKHRDKKGKERIKEKQTNGASTSGERTLKLFNEQNGELFNKKNTNPIIFSVDSRLPARTVDYNEISLGHNHKVSLAVESNGAKVMQISDRKINNESNGDRSQMGDGVPTRRHYESSGTFCQITQLDNDFNDSNLAKELDRRLKNDAEQPYDPTPVGRKPVGAQQKLDGGVIKMVSLDSMEGGDHRINDARENCVETKSVGAAVVSDHFDEHERMPRKSLGGNCEKGAEGYKRTKHREDELHNRREKRKDRNGEKKSHGKDKIRGKEKRVDRGNSRGDQTKAEQSTVEGPKMDILHGSTDHKMLHHGKYGENNLSKGETSKKAKEQLTNGFYHVTGPIKLSGPSSYNLQTVNGRAPEPCEIPVTSSPGQGGTNNVKVDKIGKVNGIIETHVQRAAAELAVKVKPRPRSPHPTATEQVAQARPKSPHPDAERLSEILSVPKLEELSDLDDFDWLFSHKERPEKRLKIDDSCGGVSNADAETPQVWSQATTIESADTYALPYVIPY